MRPTVWPMKPWAVQELSLCVDGWNWSVLPHTLHACRQNKLENYKPMASISCADIY